MVNGTLVLVVAALASASGIAVADCPRGRAQQGSNCIANSKPPCAEEYKQLGAGEFAICVIKPGAATAPPPVAAPAPPSCPPGTRKKADGSCEATKSGGGGNGG